MCTLVNAMLREKRISFTCDEYFIAQNETELKALLKEQMKIYSYQFKTASSIFSKDQCSLSGKVGGFRDDLAILIQLAAYWTSMYLTQQYE
jgi:hypothetical protein